MKQQDQHTLYRTAGEHRATLVIPSFTLWTRERVTHTENYIFLQAAYCPTKSPSHSPPSKCQWPGRPTNNLTEVQCHSYSQSCLNYLHTCYHSIFQFYIHYMCTAKGCLSCKFRQAVSQGLHPPYPTHVISTHIIIHVCASVYGSSTHNSSCVG